MSAWLGLLALIAYAYGLGAASVVVRQQAEEIRRLKGEVDEP